MLVFRRVDCSDMRYYIKQLLFKSSKGKGARSPRADERGCGSPQNVSTTEGLRKDRKRKLDAVIVEDDTRPTVSSFLFKQFVQDQGINFEWTGNWLYHILCVLRVHTQK